jgi:protein-disulfide isomerase
MNKEKSFCILKQISISTIIPLAVIIGIVNFAPPSVASLILNPDKIMKVAQYKQKKEEGKAVKKAQKLIQDDLKSPTGNLLNNSFDPSIGAGKDAELTIVEYIDYKCGYCKKAHFVLDEVLKNEKYKGKIRVIIKNYPVIGGEASLYAAEVATSFFKKNPEKFVELHTKLFASKLESPAEIDAILKAFVLQYKDIKSEEVRQAIIENFNFARSIGISGTPAFIIGDELVGGFVTYDEISKKIDEKLK